MIDNISILIIPIIISIILVYGYIKGINLYDTFVEGASEGFKTSINIMPYLISIFIAIGMMRKSGAIDLLNIIMKKPMLYLGLPPEILPLALMRPVSGSGSLGILKDILTTYGPDSFIGRVASTMMGSSETIFYTMAVYFGAIGIKNTRHTIPAALLSHLAAIVASVWVCNLFFST